MKKIRGQSPAMSRGLNAFTWPKGLEIKHYRDPELERAQDTGQRTLKCVLPSALSAVTQTGSVGIALRGLALSVDMADRVAARQVQTAVLRLRSTSAATA
ncbi:hypothetical protein CPAR01_04028 [Colletotrichum paranaense]|uniref:Uncharacterized protein n=1 Tax=Colletotrichum paranaense TaxID=1914294 RepID=A0ABQ9SVN1_9PEZI|nr:uncharacterized protein CPAR01_04028 [Colletotrichum paranaense]KAK1543395.1 hypothetical protein CPAR01_04028 [Colletotrichum paranaense]